MDPGAWLDGLLELPGHLQPGGGFGTRRNHSVSRAVLRRPERGCCTLLPEHGVRRTIPHSSGGSSSPGCPERLGQDPRWQEGDLPGEGPPGVQQAHLRGGKTEASGEGRRARDWRQTQWKGVVLDPEDPKPRAGGQTDGQVMSVLLLSARLKHKETASGRGCRLREGRETWVSSRFPERKQRRSPAGQGPHTLEGVTPGVERQQPGQEPNACTAR